MIECARPGGCVSRSSRVVVSCRWSSPVRVPQAAAAACGASRATGYRLWRRYQEGGWAALVDRPPVPKRQPRRLPRELEQRILAAREYAKAGPVIVAGQLGLPASTVWKVLRRYGVSRLRRPPAGRSSATSASGRASSSTSTSRSSAASGRSASASTATGSTRNRHAGWQYLHLAIDDHSRLAYAELLPSESPADCVAFLRRAVGWYADHGITVERVLTDNGNGYRSHAWRDRLRRARDRPPLHPPPPTADQRQSRSARQDPAPRMGLPLRLPHKRPPRPSTPRLPPLVQPPPTTQLARRPTTDQPRLTGLWAPHLVGWDGYYPDTTSQAFGSAT